MENNQIQANEAEELLHHINSERGLLWEKIEKLKAGMVDKIDGCVSHKPGDKQSKQLKESFPLKQHIEGGLYTRELFMPKGSLIVSMIHKQDHPSFLLKGKLSFIADNGTVKNIEAPCTVFTKAGTQRVFYTHEDVEWCCVYKTDETIFEKAEADVYVNDYRELPIELINKNKLLWQD